MEEEEPGMHCLHMHKHLRNSVFQIHITHCLYTGHKLSLLVSTQTLFALIYSTPHPGHNSSYWLFGRSRKVK
jgi:hypothetical protein